MCLIKQCAPRDDEVMKCLLCLLYLVFAYVHGTTPPDDRLCQKWVCLNEKLNLTDSPSKENYGNFLRTNLPDDWKGLVDTVLDECYDKRHFSYSNACPGQRATHCIVDQLTKNCPAVSLRKEDACARLRSPAISNPTYLFSQSRYNDFEKNLLIERRPESFMRNYFNNKCCDIPPLYEAALSVCGFRELINYHVFDVQKKYAAFTTPKTTPMSMTTTEKKQTTTDNIILNEFEKSLDPLDCCDMEKFIKKEWRTDCDFKLKWDVENRLTVINSTEPVATTTTESSLKYSDIKITPISCEQETCIFSKLNVISNGVVNTDAILKLLDNMKSSHQEWSQAKTRVLHQCLNKPVIGYNEGCELNNILACIFDTLTEKCPDASKNDPCAHSAVVQDGIICQISGSIYRPKHRRQFCNFPEFVPAKVLSECGVNSIFKVEYVPKPVVKSNSWNNNSECKELTESSKCLLQKMDVLNKYGFINQFKMRKHIRSYSANDLISSQYLYENVFQNAPLYKDHCGASRKLLNLIDAMLQSCPRQNIKRDEKCSNLVNNARTTVPNIKTFSSSNLENFARNTPKYPIESSFRSNPIFNFGILGAGDIPPVKLIDLKPTEKTLVLLPVYSRIPKDPLAINSLHNDSVFRS